MIKKEISKNKKAFFDYQILDTIEAGLILTGPEVKSVKNGQVNLKGSHVSFNGQKAGIVGLHISRYKPAGNLPDYDPERWRELLLHKKQTAYLRGKLYEKGLTVVPLVVYTNGRLVKVELGVVRGKKEYNKKEIIRKKDVEKEIRRTLKTQTNYPDIKSGSRVTRN